MSCGKRMTITRKDVAQAKGKERTFQALSLFKPLLLLVLLALLVTAILPQAPFVNALPEKEKAPAVARVAARVNGLLMEARAKRAVKTSFTADELMVYLKSRQIRPGQPETISFRIAGATLVVRQQNLLGPYRVGKNSVGPLRYSREVTVAPKGRIFQVLSGRFGHLTLPGPLGKLVSGAVAREFMLNPAEQTIEKQITQMSIQDGKLEIVLGP